MLQSRNKVKSNSQLNHRVLAPGQIIRYNRYPRLLRCESRVIGELRGRTRRGIAAESRRLPFPANRFPFSPSPSPTKAVGSSPGHIVIRISTNTIRSNATNVTLAADRSEYELVHAPGSVSFIHERRAYRLARAFRSFTSL
jgi:hypothetical protein